MTVTGGGIKKSENFADVIYGSPLSSIKVETFTILCFTNGRKSKRRQTHQVSRGNVSGDDGDAARLFEDSSFDVVESSAVKIRDSKTRRKMDSLSRMRAKEKLESAAVDRCIFDIQGGDSIMGSPLKIENGGIGAIQSRGEVELSIQSPPSP